MNPPDLEQISLTVFLLTFVVGVVTGFNPCCYTMLPAIMGYLCGYCQPSTKRCAWLSVLFAAGLATATALLGLIVVLVGGYFGGLHPLVKIALALVPVVMGLHTLRGHKHRVAGLAKMETCQFGRSRRVPNGTDFLACHPSVRDARSGFYSLLRCRSRKPPLRVKPAVDLWGGNRSAACPLRDEYRVGLVAAGNV